MEHVAFGWGLIALLLLVAALAAACMGPRRWRKALAVLVALACLGVPWCAPAENTLVRGVASIFASLVVMRIIDLGQDRRRWSPRHRIWLVVGLLDTRKLIACPRQIQWRALAWAAISTGVGWMAFEWASQVDPAGPEMGVLAWLRRWFWGAVMVYCMPEALQQFLRSCYAGVGLSVPVMHRAPILSTSVREFWGQRWNLVVHEWLSTHLFWPLARRRRPKLGIGAAFAASVLLHFWFVFVALDTRWALGMGSFFLLQGVIVSFEPMWNRPGINVWWMRVRTVALVAIPSPLFVEPTLRILEGRL